MSTCASPSLKVPPTVNHNPTPQPQSIRPTEHRQSQHQDNNDDGRLHRVTSLREVCADIHDRVTRFLSASPSNEVMKSTQAQTQVAMSVITKALHDYDFDALSLSYNGGKDCLVLLILYLSVLHTHFTQPSGRRKPQSQGRREHNGTDTDTDTGVVTTGTSPSASAPTTDFPRSIPSIYAKPPDPFDSVTTFVESSTRDYHLDLVHISTTPGFSSQRNSKSHSSHSSSQPPTSTTTSAPDTTVTTTPIVNGDTSTSTSTSTSTTSNHTSADPSHLPPDQPTTVTFRDAFALYLRSHPSVRAIFVGTRRTDPHGAKLDHFQMTDGNWPRFIRIHPVIDWRLSEIWCFLRSEHLADPGTGKKLEYCGMYDAGYTSLGGVGDTLRNPKLRYTSAGGVESYRPAYEMTEDDEERAGRE